MKDFPKVVECYEKSLHIVRERIDRQGQTYANCNLGNTYNPLRDFPKAIKCSEKSLYIVRELGDLSITNKCSFKSTILHNALRRFCFDVCG